MLAGPDHLAAVGPLAADGRRRTWLTGLSWGAGHAGGVIIVGTLALAFREVLPVEAMSGWAERLVGVILIAIGIWGGRKALGMEIHSHRHTHDGETHVHLHAHDAAESHDQAQAHRHSHVHTHAALGVGVLHGLAGTSHFLGVLPTLAFDDRTERVAYLASFGLGTILAMTLFAAVIGVIAQRLTRGFAAFRALLLALSAAAIVVGVVWLIGLG